MIAGALKGNRLLESADLSKNGRAIVENNIFGPLGAAEIAMVLHENMSLKNLNLS